jgi:hypothetical protein
VGVVLHFGKFFHTLEPGLHFKLPLGIDSVTVLPTRRQLKLEFGFSTAGYTNPLQAGQDPEEEKSMVTGDRMRPSWSGSCNIASKTRGSISSMCAIRREPSGIYPRPQCVR